MSKPTFTTEFKIDSANLVINQGYSVNEACQAVGVSESAIRRWVKQLKEEQRGFTPIGSKALTHDQQRIQELEAKIKRIEREKEILLRALGVKKATALLMSDTMR
jgi:transposase